MQVMPSLAVQYVPGLTAQQRAYYAAMKDGGATVAVTLLGADHAALVRCFRTGMRMLIRARAYCDWQVPPQQPVMTKGKGWPGFRPPPVQATIDGTYGMLSLYATGSTCTSGSAKVAARRAMAARVLWEFRNQRAIAAKRERLVP